MTSPRFERFRMKCSQQKSDKKFARWAAKRHMISAELCGFFITTERPNLLNEYGYGTGHGAYWEWWG